MQILRVEANKAPKVRSPSPERSPDPLVATVGSNGVDEDVHTQPGESASSPSLDDRVLSQGSVSATFFAAQSVHDNIDAPVVLILATTSLREAGGRVPRIKNRRGGGGLFRGCRPGYGRRHNLPLRALSHARPQRPHVESPRSPSGGASSYCPRFKPSRTASRSSNGGA